jgi:hypothetical protein
MGWVFKENDFRFVPTLRELSSHSIIEKAHTNNSIANNKQDEKWEN